MDNNTSDKLIPSYNIVQQQQNQFTLEASSVEKPGLSAPNPISNPQANNQAQPYNPNIPPQGNYPYNPNIPPQPYNPNIPPQGNYPYNPNMPYYSVTVEYPSRGIVANPQPINPTVGKCLNTMLLIMSILMLTFLIVEIILLSSIGEAFKNGYVIAYEIGILTVAILFIVSFILSIMKKNIIILSVARTIITVCVWFVGMPLRSIGTLGDFKHDSTYVPLLIIRGFLLFFSIPFSVINCQNAIISNRTNLVNLENPTNPTNPTNNTNPTNPT